MGHFTTITRQMISAACGMCIFAVPAPAVIAISTFPTAAAAAGNKPTPPPPTTEADQKKIAAAAARRAYDSGVQAYGNGKHQSAVDQLSTALRGGGLTSAEMAKALYLRGAAYKRLDKPGLAISDLTSALWLKNGLGEVDQKAAMAERAEAYRMAGLGDGVAGDKVSVADPNPKPAGAKAVVPAASAPSSPVAAPVAAAAEPAQSPQTLAIAADAMSGHVTRQSPDSEAARDAANARRNAAQPVEGNGLQAAASATVLGNSNAAAPSTPSSSTIISTPSFAAPTSSPASAPVLSAAPIEDQSQSTGSVATSSGGGLASVGGFFSNLFNGGASPSTATGHAESVTTASTTPPPAKSSWSESTSVASSSAKPSLAKPVSTAAVAPAKAGKYKLHIAAVRSRAEADALAQKLASQQGSALQNRMPVVDEAVIGSMGTFYRVRVGSYTNADEPRGVCNTLRSSGYDCLVVTN